MSHNAHIQIVEMGARDGLQNEPTPVSLAVKQQLITQLVEAGLHRIEIGSFVSAKWVPQMADTDALARTLLPHPKVTYSALTPNLKGFEDALAASLKEVAVFTAASDAFTQKNINCSVAESLERFAPLFARAKEEGVRVRGYVSCVLGCPYQGATDPAKVAEVTGRLLRMGCYEVSLGDTIGVGTTRGVKTLLSRLLQDTPASTLAVHFHDTYGQALANIATSLDFGIQTIDASVAGLGGCPYAKGASGNVATEDVVYLLEGNGLSTGVDLDRLIQAGATICKALGRRNGSKVALAKGTPL
ncbi:MAG: hydroxymethylglutaryl-CoA lyase [Hahellaceae bacterium]|nr:hydroxymethylglutaryl-CoA lyase [Hahellaceae bacterium]